MGKKVCIVGFSDLTRDWVNDLPGDFEVWGLNEGHRCTRWVPVRVIATGELKKVKCPCQGPPHAGTVCTCRGHSHWYLPRYDRWFQIHPKDWHLAIRRAKAKEKGGTLHPADEMTFGRNEKHVIWLSQCGVPVYMLYPDERIPTAVHYPLEEVTETVGIEKIGEKWLYATSSPAYMMALALHEHLTGQAPLDTFALCGLELAVGTEYYWQRPCVEYYLGLMRGMGIKTPMPPGGSSLLAAPRYAIDPQPIVPWDLANEKFLYLKDSATPVEVEVREEIPLPA